ncbi:hypothetical protein [Moheibacter sediminis]|uniref:GLPGLI family protein n=1 Tax=Moheibacter sediminis TaxID=1434700 RepID=A0A1W1ZDM1_9FLAO|nr:hypothetical protein [Moheibacter sediminis]SMC46251.1 hypothetical protein SAMN06296427_102395 [Moheibacter sediminis]
MKRLTLLIIFLFSITALAQEKLKVGDKIKVGILTLINDQPLSFYDLEFATDGKVKFMNSENNQSEFLYLSSVKSIQETEGVVYDKQKLDEIEYVKYVAPTPKVKTYSTFKYKDETIELENPSEGKAVVYLVRTGGAGSMVNFRYFEGNKFLGKFSGKGYLRYECEPGEHIFWAASENSYFVKSELDAGKIYVIEVVGAMGVLYAQVTLDVVDRFDAKKYPKHQKRLFPVLSNKDLDRSSSTLPAQSGYEREIENGMEKYKRLNEKGDVKILHANQYFE